ncbi:MAG: hypothetical protein IKO68_06640 [Oscillospiraceae bacterium]|nr:hypothetical protein [Oscillospiraceae bacterium]
MLFFASIGQEVTQRTGDILPDYFDPFQTDPLSSQSREKRRDILEPLIEDNR